MATVQTMTAASEWVVRSRATGRVHRPAGQVQGGAASTGSGWTWCGRTLGPVDVVPGAVVPPAASLCGTCWKAA